MSARDRNWIGLIGVVLTSAVGCDFGPSGPSRSASEYNLKLIRLGMWNYRSSYGVFPPVSGSGNRNVREFGYSFRVSLLPFVQNDRLYGSVFRGTRSPIDRPQKDVWDNPELLNATIKWYNTDPTDPRKTHYRAIVGGGAFDENGLPVPDANKDCIMIVEASESVVWTKPDELVYKADQPLPKFGFLNGGFHAIFVDESLRWIPSSTPEPEIRRMITGGK